MRTVYRHVELRPEAVPQATKAAEEAGFTVTASADYAPDSLGSVLSFAITYPATGDGLAEQVAATESLTAALEGLEQVPRGNAVTFGDATASRFDFFRPGEDAPYLTFHATTRENFEAQIGRLGLSTADVLAAGIRVRVTGLAAFDADLREPPFFGAD